MKRMIVKYSKIVAQLIVAAIMAVGALLSGGCPGVVRDDRIYESVCTDNYCTVQLDLSLAQNDDWFIDENGFLVNVSGSEKATTTLHIPEEFYGKSITEFRIELEQSEMNGALITFLMLPEEYVVWKQLSGDGNVVVKFTGYNMQMEQNTKFLITAFENRGIKIKSVTIKYRNSNEVY